MLRFVKMLQLPASRYDIELSALASYKRGFSAICGTNMFITQYGIFQKWQEGFTGAFLKLC